MLPLLLSHPLVPSRSLPFVFSPVRLVLRALENLTRNHKTSLAVVLLRTSSTARAVFLGYLVLLHFWVFLVLVFRSHERGLETKPAMPNPTD